MATTPKITYELSARLHEVLVDTFEDHLDESELLPLFTSIIEARFRPDTPTVQALALSKCLAEVMANPVTPVDLYNAIGDAVTHIQNEVSADAILRTDGLVPALIAIAAKQRATELPSGKENQEAMAQNAADMLVAFMEDEMTPPGLSDAIGDAVIQFVEQHDGTNTGIEVARFQLAAACMKAAAEKAVIQG